MTDTDKMFLRIRFRKKLVLGIKYFFLVLLSLFFLFPFASMFFRSFMSNADVLNLPVKFFPKEWTLDAYKVALDADLIRYFLNTLIVLAVNVICVPLVASLGAFAFSKMDFDGKELVFSIMLMTIMLPSIAVQIPLYSLYSNLGWINTLYPLTVPAIFGGGALNIFLIRQFMRGIPNELMHASEIDGANTCVVFFKIIFPLCLPVISLVAVNTFIGVWNDFMGPLMFLKDESQYTLAVGVYMKFIGSVNLNNLANIQMATGMLLIIPPAILFFIFQKQLIEGVTLGGVKE